MSEMCPCWVSPCDPDECKGTCESDSGGECIFPDSLSKDWEKCQYFATGCNTCPEDCSFRKGSTPPPKTHVKPPVKPWSRQSPDMRFHKTKKMPSTFWAITDPNGEIITDTVKGKRWESVYEITHSPSRFPHNWRTVYYNRGYRAVKVLIATLRRQQEHP